MQKIKDLIATYPTLEGTKVLQVLVENPNQPIYSSVLQNCLTLGVSPEAAQDSQYHCSTIPMTDYATLQAVDSRINHLISLKAHITTTAVDSDTSTIDAELKALKRYRYECTRPNGAIKSFNDDDRMAYRRFNAAIRRLLDRAEKDGHHEAVAIVKRQLKQGRQMVWGEFGEVARW